MQNKEEEGGDALPHLLVSSEKPQDAVHKLELQFVTKREWREIIKPPSNSEATGSSIRYLLAESGTQQPIRVGRGVIDLVDCWNRDANVGLAFAYVQYIMIEANFGWLIRSVHRWSARVPKAIPVIGSPLVELSRGSASVGQSTLTCVYSLHTARIEIIDICNQPLIDWGSKNIWKCIHFLCIEPIYDTIRVKQGI
ncbi:hypothetical protein NC651_039864 [Populus alba x Populus x berolinensis]|nr:hypothetical protein NC651_039864 [Populus alba x Populus x berolinensis]